MRAGRRLLVGMLCHYCMKPARNWDHIVPRGRGGLDVGWNRIPSCVKCNTDKGCEMPTCICPRCLWALYRWQRGEKGPAIGRRKQLRNKRRKRKLALASLEAEKEPSIVPRILSGRTREEWIEHEKKYAPVVPNWML